MNATVARGRVPDPDVERLLDAMAEAPALETLSPADARAAMSAAVPLLCLDMPECEEARHSLGGVAVRGYRPVGSAGRRLPALLFFHGGGWVIGDLDGYAPLCAAIAREADICVLSVDYRLAPEHPFPAAFEDALAVAAALDGEAAELAIDGERIAVGGDSAGGNLAAALCLARRDAGAPPYRAQLLLYPVLDARLSQPSYRDFGVGWFLTAALMHWFRDLYLPGGGDPVDWRVSPLLAPDLADLPETHLLTCGLDPLQDEARLFADRLEDAGVALRRTFYPGQIHGFLYMGRAIAAAGEAISAIARDLAATLRR